MNKNLIRKAILGNNLLWKCCFYDELIVTPSYDLTHTFNIDTKFMSSAQRINVSKDDFEEELVQIEKFYNERNKPISIYLDPAMEPENLEELLVQKKFREEKELEEIWHFLDLKDLKEQEIKLDNFVIEQCVTDAQRNDHLKAALEGYGDFKLWATQLYKNFKTKVDGIEVIHYVAYLNGKPVSNATLGIYFDIAILINTAVIPEARRKGIHTALMMQRLVDAKKFGAKVAFYQTDFDNEASIGTGKKIGFEEGFRRRLFVKE